MSDLDKHIEQLRACRPIPEADVRIPQGARSLAMALKRTDMS